MRFASFSKFRSSYSIHGLIIPSPFLLNPPFTRPQSSNSKGPTSAPAAPIVFDRPLKTLQKDNAARLSLLQPEAEEDEAEGGGVLRYQYLRDEIASRLVERLEDVKDRSFDLCLDLGSGSGSILRAINRAESLTGNGGGIGGVRKLVQVEGSGLTSSLAPLDPSPYCTSYTLPSASEGDLPLPFPDCSFDAVLSCLSLHWINDLPGTLSEANRVLKPDGALLLAVPGGETLPELRSSLLLAEQERRGGITPRVGPFVDVPSVGMLLQRAGFKLPTVDVDTVAVGYPDMFVLMEHLQGMGEANASAGREGRGGGDMDVFLSAAAIYGEMYPLEEGEGGVVGGEVVATAQVIYAVGWKEHESQQKPDRRGSGSARIGDVSIEKTE